LALKKRVAIMPESIDSQKVRGQSALWRLPDGREPDPNKPAKREISANGRKTTPASKKNYYGFALEAGPSSSKYILERRSAKIAEGSARESEEGLTMRKRDC
jgi:hypothetical protein